MNDVKRNAKALDPKNGELRFVQITAAGTQEDFELFGLTADGRVYGYRCKRYEVERGRWENRYWWQPMPMHVDPGPDFELPV